MKKFSLIAILLIAVMMIVGCSHNAEVSKNVDESESISFSANNTENNNSKIVTENESSTQISTTETTAVQNITKPKEKQENTTKKTTTKKHTATQSETKKQTTTKKQAETTTKKPTTTKKVTTTEDFWDCNVDGHTSDAGQIGWCNSYNEAAKKARKYIDNNADSGGYVIEQCHMCGKYTAYITLD